MELSDISYSRLFNQKIGENEILNPKELVANLGAIQAQDFNMSKWAIGLRLFNTTIESIENAFNRGEIIRTHLMRPTWHIVSADDIYWMLALTAPRIKQYMKGNDLKLGVTQDFLNTGFKILEKEILSNGAVTRDDLKYIFEKHNLNTDENRLTHILMNAELDGLICSGAIRNNKITYDLLEKRVPEKKVLSREESLTELAKRYFTSHGPATLQDFAWWSGLLASDCRKAIEMNKNELNSEKVGNETYWFKQLYKSNTGEIIVSLLPAFDELLISYRDRQAIITEMNNKKAISENGIFRPIIVMNGKAIGIWKRSIKKMIVNVDLSFFENYDSYLLQLLETEINKYGNFINKKIIISVNYK